MDRERLKTIILVQVCVCVCVLIQQPRMQSEAIPEGWDTHLVKELVGMNLEEVAFNPNKTVFVMFCM